MFWLMVGLVLVGWLVPDLQAVFRRPPSRWGTTFEEEPRGPGRGAGAVPGLQDGMGARIRS